MPTIKARLQVRRTTVETTFVEAPVDVAEFTEWSGGVAPNDAPYATLVEYAESSAAWPHDIEALVNTATWRTVETEWELPR